MRASWLVIGDDNSTSVYNDTNTELVPTEIEPHTAITNQPENVRRTDNSKKRVQGKPSPDELRQHLTARQLFTLFDSLTLTKVCVLWRCKHCAAPSQSVTPVLCNRTFFHWNREYTPWRPTEKPHTTNPSMKARIQSSTRKLSSILSSCSFNGQ